MLSKYCFSHTHTKTVKIVFTHNYTQYLQKKNICIHMSQCYFFVGKLQGIFINLNIFKTFYNEQKPPSLHRGRHWLISIEPLE